MSIVKRQINFSPNFVSFFIVMTHNSSVKFKLIHFLLWIKGSIKVPILRLSSALVKICKTPHIILQNTNQFYFKFCITLQRHVKSLLCTFLGQTLYTLHKRNQSKYKFLWLLSARVKIHQILVIFKTTNQLFFKFYITLQRHMT